MRYTVEYQEDNYDEPSQYMVRDTKHNRIVALVFIREFVVPVEGDEIKQRKAVIEGELAAMDMAKLIAEKLETAAENGEVQ